jgi:acyl dehydratase
MPRIAIDAEQSARFAQLSGDFNPLHVDPIRSRRLQFGSTVCHGVHVALKAIDAALASGRLPPQPIGAIDGVFRQPVPTGCEVDIGVDTDADGAKLGLTLTGDGRAVATVRLRFDATAPVATEALPAGAPFEAADPAQLDFPLDAGACAALHGAVRLAQDQALLATLFPALARLDGGAALARDIGACTCVVGMHCPGLHSIFTELHLKRQASMRSSHTFTYAVERSDARFRSVTIAVQGPAWFGRLEALFRSPPVQQRPLIEVARATSSSALSGHRVLVVGGSRGLGEVAAKLLMAGGADVTITYMVGRDDAAAIQDEARSLGLKCQVLQLDVGQPLPDPTRQLLGRPQFTHVYYFASPPIRPNPHRRWNEDAFDTYLRCYVSGFLACIEAVVAGREDPAGPELRVCFPSTEFLDTRPAGFEEYCCAKAAGEAVCDDLERRGVAVVVRPRLPRLYTDQTGSLGPSQTLSPEPIMARLVQAMHSPTSPPADG